MGKDGVATIDGNTGSEVACEANEETDRFFGVKSQGKRLEEKGVRANQRKAIDTHAIEMGATAVQNARQDRSMEQVLVIHKLWASAPGSIPPKSSPSDIRFPDNS